MDTGDMEALGLVVGRGDIARQRCVHDICVLEVLDYVCGSSSGLRCGGMIYSCSHS